MVDEAARGWVMAVWQRVVADESMVRQYGGPLPRQGEWASLRTLIDRMDADGVAHWADFPLAQAWIAEAVRLASDESERAATTPRAQEELTVALWRAIGNAYRALDLPWVVDPAARAAYVRMTSGAESRLICDAGEWQERARRMGAYVSPVGGQCVTILHRVALRVDGTVALDLHLTAPSDAVLDGRRLLEDVVDGTPMHAGRQRAAARSQDGYWRDAVHPGGALWSWHSYAWHRECHQRGGVDCDFWESRLFPPLFWYYELGRVIARSLADRGALRVVLEGVRFSVLLNLRNAQAADVLGRAGANEAVSSAAAGLVGLSEVQFAEQAADLRDAAVSQGQEAVGVTREVASLLGLVATGAAATGVGLIITGVIALWLAALNLLPLAAQADIDFAGRRRPVAERATITGGDHNHPPTHDVEEPPGGVSRPLIIVATGFPFGGGSSTGGARSGPGPVAWLAGAAVLGLAVVLWRARDSGAASR
ncbi:MAG: hypothetical protein U0324_46310 [Polyangiales bacterium]